MKKKKQEIKYTFHNPNETPEQQEAFMSVLLKVCMETLKPQVDKIIADYVDEQGKETEEMDQKLSSEQIKNKRLIEEYPFLLPRNRFTDEVVKDFNYEFTELDSLPVGWRKAFGDALIKELKEVLLKGQYLEKYRILQIKEKFGYLRWYDGNYPNSIAVEMNAVKRKYERLSERTCIMCGKPATVISLGWISPYCDCCKKEGVVYTPIEEYFKDE